jgi:holo-[acyl-carrier protein] synthase
VVFGIGTDIIEVHRVEEKLRRTNGLKEKLFTEREIAYCDGKSRPARHFAARFAAKEAFLKAMGTGWSGGYRFDEIEIVANDKGQPGITVHGNVEDYCNAHGIARMRVSMSHIEDVAQAVVVLETAS